MAQGRRKLINRERFYSKRLDSVNQERRMVSGYILLSVSPSQLAVDLLLVCYQCCQRLASLVLVLLLLFVLFLRLSVSVLRLWDFFVVFGGRLRWRAGRWRSSPFVLLLFWGGM